MFRIRFYIKCHLKVNLALFIYMYFYLQVTVKISIVETFEANKRISYFFPLRCFLSLMNLMSMNFKLINLMSMNFKLINLKLVVFLYFLVLFSALYSFCAFLYLWNLIVKKNKKFKTGLMTSFILLLKLAYYNLF